MNAIPAIDLPARLVRRCTPYKLTAIDCTLDEEARRQGIQPVGLESDDELIPVFENILEEIYKHTCRLITAEKTKPGSWKKIVTEDMDAFINGDQTTLVGLLETNSNEKKRNERMVSRSIDYLKEPSLVGVGIGHFLAEPSMLTLYRQKGIEVKRIQ